MAIGYNNEFAHAEVNAINLLKKKYSKNFIKNLNKKGLILEVVRFHNTRKEFNLSKPCVNCQKKINCCKFITKVYHS